LRARYLAHAVAHTTALGWGAHTTAAPSSPRPRRQRPRRDCRRPWCVTFRASNPRGARETIVWRPDDAVGPRRRQGRDPPPSPLGAFRRTPWAAFEAAGGRSVHVWPHAGVTATDPPGSGAARHSSPRPHAGPLRTQPHRPSRDPVRRPMAARPHAGPQPIQIWRIRCGQGILGGKHILFPENHFFL
jgi:hypothetical protein